MKMDVQVWQARWQKMACEVVALEQWLLLHAAAVIFADKAGELLAVPANQFALSQQEILTESTRFAALLNLRCRALNTSDHSLKLIIYAPSRIRAQLAQTPPCTLCNELGYCTGAEPEDFLQEIATRWQQRGEIPHEIGLALGYPIKDVLGFMGLNQLPCTGCFGWRVYGDPAPSRQASQCYQAARHHAQRLTALAAHPQLYARAA